MTSAKTYFLCVGAQKAGTTWLHKQLVNSDSFYLGWKKELHVFDRMWVPFLSYDLTMNPKKFWRRRFENFPAGGKTLLVPWNSRRIFQNYFDSLLTNSNATFLGEFCPSYSGLSARHFSQVRTEAAKRGLSTKVLMILRDPIARVLSGIAHSHRQLNLTSSEFNALVLREHRSFQVRKRTQYEHTIPALEKVFGPNELRFYFFEELFSDFTRFSLEQWLGIALNPFDFETRVGASNLKPEMEDFVIEKIGDSYRETYQFTVKKFGRERVRQCWPFAAPILEIDA
jgi:hypothetical protein